MLSVVKLLLKREVGGCALSSHGNYIVDHGKSWKNHGIVFLNFCGNSGVDLYDQIRFVLKLCCRNCNLTFCAKFCPTKPFLSLHSDVICVSIELSVASQMSNLWQNNSGSTGKQKTY